MKQIVCLAALVSWVAAGCALPEQEPTDGEPVQCADTVVEGIGAGCRSSAECSGYLVCENQGCVLPQAMRAEGGESLPVTSPEGATSRLFVEVVRGDAGLARGIDGRPCMAEGWGLLLEYPTSSVRTFSAAQIAMEVDLAFADSNGLVGGLHEHVAAGSDEEFGSELPASYLLIVAAGFSESLGLVPGASIEP